MDEAIANLITCTYFNGDSQCGKPAKKLVNDHPACTEHIKMFKVKPEADNVIVPLDSRSGEHPRKVARD